MPKNLTDASVWEPVVVVPVDTDPADAPSVEVGFQDLANRAKWLLDSVARIFAYNLVGGTTSAVAATGKQIASFAYDELNDWVSFFWHNAAGSLVHESIVKGATGEVWPAISAVYSGAGTITGLDAAASHQGRRHVVVSGIADIVRQSLSGAAWAAVTWTAGAPSKNWLSVGCDRGSTGSGYKFLIGDDGAGPAAPVVWVSTDGTSYAALATFPALTAGYKIAGIFHTEHPVDLLGPDDPGNPSWLVLATLSTNSMAVVLRSTDGVTWNQLAAPWAGAGQWTRAAAYSPLFGRWVVAMQGAAVGDIRYSDNNGETWTTVSAAITPTSVPVEVVCDGYGTFIAWNVGGTDEKSKYFVSVDGGLTWETVLTPFSSTTTPTTTWYGVLGAAVGSAVKRAQAIYFGAHDSGVATPIIYRTLKR